MRYSLGDISILDLMGDNFWNPVATTMSIKGQFVDTDKFDIVPKREYLDKEIARKEEELKQAEIRHRQHEERIREEIEGLKDQRDKKRK